MGGKRLKFPSRAKYVPPEKKSEEIEEEQVSEEEHKKRIEMLKRIGILKE
ncbi:MAG: hypothetical protein Q8N63_08695 [Nanoarchaeota archaeon]|nr:hypothetical protein [Nanoarchaeota archaeon]